MARESIEKDGAGSSPLLVKQVREIGGDGERQEGGSSSATTMVVLSTLVAVAGSYVFGTAVGYSSPSESDIMSDLNLSVADYSLFGSILTIGAMVGAITSGRIADYIGRREYGLFRNILHHRMVSNSILEVDDMYCGVDDLSYWSICVLANFGIDWT